MASGVIQVDAQYFFDDINDEKSEVESSDNEEFQESERQMEVKVETQQEFQTASHESLDSQQLLQQQQQQLQQPQGPWFQQDQQQQQLQQQQYQYPIYQQQQQLGYNIPFQGQQQSPNQFDYQQYYQGTLGYLMPQARQNEIAGGQYRQNKIKNIGKPPKKGGSRPGSASNIKQGAPYLQKYAGIKMSSAFNPSGSQSNYLRFQKQQTLDQETYSNESLNTRMVKNFFQNQNTLLKAQVKSIEKELKRKDQVIKQLIEQANRDTSSITPNESYHSQHPSLNPGGMQNSSGTLVNKYKQKIKQLKSELVLKQEEVNNMQRSLKYTKIQEFTVEISQLQAEINRVTSLLQQEVARPKIEPVQFFKLQEEFQQQQMMIRTLQQEHSQLTQTNIDKDAVILKRDRKIGKLTDKVKSVKEKNKNLLKKMKILHAKINELERFGAGMLSKSTNRGRNPAQQSIERIASGSQSPTRCPYHHKKKNGTNQADIYEQYCVEKIKNERLIARLKKLGLNIDPEQVYQEEQDQEQPVSSERLPLSLPFHFNGITKVIAIPETLGELLEHLQSEFELETTPILRAKSQPKEYIQDIGQLQSPDEEVFLEIQDEEQEDEANQYEEEQFDEYEEEGVDMVKEDEVKLALLEIKLKLQIKRVKKEHAFKYVMNGIPKAKDGSKDKLVRLAQFQQQLISKFKLKTKDCLSVARFLIEESDPKRKGKVVFNEQREVKRRVLKARFRKAIGDYGLYNGLALTSYLNRLTRVFEDSKEQIEELIKETDEDDLGEVSFKEFEQILKASDAPELEQDLKEFLYFILLRQSETLHFLNYQAFLDTFNEDYLIPKSQHEDKREFEPQSDSSQNVSENEGEGPRDQLADILIDEEDLMVTVDDVLEKIVKKFPGEATKALSKAIKPLISFQSMGEKRVHYLEQNDFVKFLKQSLSPIQEKEVQCILHILVREDLQGVIIYDEFKQLIKNYIKKENKFLKSISQGIRYDLIGDAPELLAFIQQIKQVTNPTDEEGNVDTAKQVEIKTILKKAIRIQTVLARDKKQQTVEVVEFESMLDQLFMSHQIRCPPMKVQDSLKMMLCLDERYPDLVLVKKLERILVDLDFVYVNLLKIQKRPEYQIQFKPKQSPIRQQQQANYSPPQVDSNPKQKREVQFQKEPEVEEKKKVSRVDSANSEFQYDSYRKKFTMKAEEVPSDDDDLEQDISNVSSVNKQKQKQQQAQKQQTQAKAAVAKPTQPKKKEEDEGHKMDFYYDPLRKKHTVKAQEVEEEDFIEDNYE